jgi:hypothetical protein
VSLIDKRLLPRWLYFCNASTRSLHKEIAMSIPFINSDHRGAALARQILAERKAPTGKIQQICLACGRPYTDGDSRFCHPRCRDAFDAGLPAYEPIDISKYYSLPMGPTGFRIKCACCKANFDSKGLRCCSPDCERDFRRKQELNAELKEDPFRVQKRQCEGCGGPIPNWRKGRRVSTATKFCSSRCRDRRRRNANLASDSPQADLPRETAKKCPENGASRRGSRKGSPPSGACISGPAGEEMPA